MNEDYIALGPIELSFLLFEGLGYTRSEKTQQLGPLVMVMSVWSENSNRLN